VVRIVNDCDAGPAAIAAIAHLTPRQLAAFYIDPPRDERGRVNYPPMFIGRRKGARELFAYRLSLLGIRDPETVESLWADEKVRQDALRAKEPKGRKRRERR
jgi:hypothetical protein